MPVYVTAFSLSILFAEMGMRTRSYKEGCKWRTAMVSMLPIFFIAAFRYMVGSDYPSYMRTFQWVAAGADVDMEWLYIWLNKVLSKFGFHYVSIFIVSALIFLIPTYLCIFEYSPYPAMSILLLFGTTYYFAFQNVMRQFMAAAILLYSLRFIEERKPKQYFALVFIASGFHATSFLFAPLYFLRRLNLTPKRAALIALFIYIFNDPIGRFILYLLGKTKYSSYETESGTLYLIRFLIQLAVLLLTSVYRNKNDRFRIYYLIQFVGTCGVGFGNIVSHAHRLVWTFGYPSLILIPMAIHEVKIRRDRVTVAIVTCLCYIAYALYILLKFGGFDGLPYQFIFKYL